MKTVDVCLVLEGTYPFVSGGVSSWVHRLTSDLPDHTFRILHISPKRGFYPKGPVYEMPKNILGVQEVHLHDYVLSARGRALALEKALYEQLIDTLCEMLESLQLAANALAELDVLITFAEQSLLCQLIHLSLQIVS